jgi:FdhD protein
MMPEQKGFVPRPVFTFDGRGFSKTESAIVREIPLQIYLNEQPLATIACTGLHLDELALGYLASEGLIQKDSDIKDMQMDAAAGIIRVLTDAATEPGKRNEIFRGNIASSGARSSLKEGQRKLPGPMTQDALQLSPDQVLQLMDRFIDQCHLHGITRGTHGAALSDGKEILVLREDIGRHNAIDMLAGYALLHHLDCSDKALLRTGRASTEIVYKAWNLGTPVVVSLSVPTAQAMQLAGDAGMTLIGAVRGRSMQIYTHERRIGL